MSHFRRRSFVRVGFILLGVDRSWLSALPGVVVYFSRVMDQGERAFLIADDDVDPLVAIQISYGNLGSHARVEVDSMRHKTGSAPLTHSFEPIANGRIAGSRILAVVCPIAFAGNNV